MKDHNRFLAREFSFESSGRQSQHREANWKLRLRVTREMSLNALRKQALAPALTSACQGGAATFRLHAGTKTVLLFTCSLRWLIGPFHKAGN